MAKFCGYCGALMDDNAHVCGNCGKPFDGTETEDSNVNNSKSRALLIIGLLLAVLAVAVIVGVSISSAGSGRQKLIRKVMKAYEKEDIDALVDMSSGIYDRDSADGLTADSYFRSIVEGRISFYESSVGHSFKLMYQVEEIYDMSERRRDEYVSSIMGTHPGIVADMITDMSAAEMKVTAKQGNRTVDDHIRIVMTKEGKDWKLLYLE